MLNTFGIKSLNVSRAASTFSNPTLSIVSLYGAMPLDLAAQIKGRKLRWIPAQKNSLPQFFFLLLLMSFPFFLGSSSISVSWAGYSSPNPPQFQCYIKTLGSHILQVFKCLLYQDNTCRITY